MIIKKDMLAFQANMIQNSWQNGFILFQFYIHVLRLDI